MKLTASAVALASVVAVSVAKGPKRKLRGAAVLNNKKAETVAESAFMKEVETADEDVDFWTRELGRNLGSGRRLEKKDESTVDKKLVVKRKADESAFIKEMKDEDVQFWTRELGRNLGSGRRLEKQQEVKGEDIKLIVDKKKADESAFMKEMEDEDVQFWTRELGRNLGSGRRLEKKNSEVKDEDVEFWTRELGRNLGSGRRQ